MNKLRAIFDKKTTALERPFEGPSGGFALRCNRGGADTPACLSSPTAMAVKVALAGHEVKSPRNFGWLLATLYS